MANGGGGTEVERLHATIGVDLSELRTGLSAAQAETRAATSGMAGSFEQSATKIDAASKKVSTGMSGVSRSAGMTGIQIGQLTQQIAGGTNAAIAFGQQLPDIAFGLQGAQGAAGKFASFMMGPWGVALTTGGMLVGLLATNLLRKADASDEAKRAAGELAAAEDRLASATANANHQTRQGILDDIARANSLRTRTQETLRLAIAEERKRIAIVKTAQAEGMRGGELATAGAMNRRTGVILGPDGKETTASIEEMQARIDQLNTRVRAGQRQIADRDIAARRDPTVRAEQRYEDAVDKSARAFESGNITLDAYRATVMREASARDATIASLQESEKAQKSSGRSAASANRKAETAARSEARQRERAAREAYRQDNAYQRSLTTAQNGLLSAQLDAADGYEERARIEREIAQNRLEREQEEILTNKDYDAVQKAHLVALAEQTSALRMRSIAMDEARAREQEMEQRWQVMADVQEMRRETELGLLSQQYDAARTMEERQNIALRIVQGEYELAAARQKELIASANRVIASEEATKAEKAAAEATRMRAEAELGRLGALLPGQREGAVRDNRTILDAQGFGQKLGDTLEEGIMEALRGKNLKDAMRDGIFGLLNDAMGEAFANLSKVAFGKDGLGGLIAGLFGGSSRAVGGPVLGGMAYNVGSGEKFIAPANGRVLSRADAMAAAGGGSMPRQITVNVNGARGNQEIMEMVRAGVAQGIGQYDEKVGARVVENTKRKAG